MSRPITLAWAAAGNLYFSETSSTFLLDERSRKIDTHGILTLVASTGASGFSGKGGPATAALAGLVAARALGSQGKLYLGVFGRVRKLYKKSIITPVAGRRPDCNSFWLDF